MSTSNKRSIDEIDRKDSDKDAQQVPGSRKELIDQASGLSKRHQPLSVQDLDSTTIDAATAAMSTTTTADNTKLDQESITSTTINNDQKESPVSTNENNADNKLVDRISLDNAAEASITSAREEQVPAATEQQQASVPDARRPVSTTTPTPKEHHQIVPVKEPTIFNIRPVDDIALYIADIIGEHCRTQHVEVSSLYSVSFYIHISISILIE